MRIISQSEIATFLDCQFKHGFAYGGLGEPIRAKSRPEYLADGSSWGSAIALLHTEGFNAAYDSLAALPEGENREKLIQLLSSYTNKYEPLNLIETEKELTVHLARPDNDLLGWYYVGHLDGVHKDSDGFLWIVEYKLRTTLYSLEQISFMRQIKWYAWAWIKQFKTMPRGIIVDETLNQLPKPIRFNKNGSVSAVQSCTAEEYVDACLKHHTPVNENTLQKLQEKQWHARHKIFFSERELAEVPEELDRVASLLRHYDSGALRPVRNTTARCARCEYKLICPDPNNSLLREEFYEENTYVTQGHYSQ